MIATNLSIALIGRPASWPAPHRTRPAGQNAVPVSHYPRPVCLLAVASLEGDFSTLASACLLWLANGSPRPLALGAHLHPTRARWAAPKTKAGHLDTGTRLGAGSSRKHPASLFETMGRHK